MSEDPQAVFEKNSRSFSLAARLFTPQARLDSARLYRFCRYVDDLADDSHGGQPALLAEIKATLVSGQISDDPILADFIRLAEERRLSRPASIELVEALHRDCGPRAIPDERALIRFAYGVAGTVGLLMCPLLECEDPRATPFAIDLGIALQLTNIARDVAEDAARDRFYLPATWVAPKTIRQAIETGHPSAVAQVDQAVGQILALADVYYQSARAGHWFIPARNRLPIFLALSFYEGIGTKLLRNGHGAWLTRTRLDFLQKMAVAFRAIPSYLRYRKRWNTEPAPTHARELHRALESAAE